MKLNVDFDAKLAPTWTPVWLHIGVQNGSKIALGDPDPSPGTSRTARNQIFSIWDQFLIGFGSIFVRFWMDFASLLGCFLYPAILFSVSLEGGPAAGAKP